MTEKLDIFQVHCILYIAKRGGRSSVNSHPHPHPNPHTVSAACMCQWTGPDRRQAFIQTNAGLFHLAL